MSNTPIQEPTAQGLSSGSGTTLPSRPLQPISDPSASKRVCFYKSGDYKFSGHRVVINARTFKTFDALLDALSKKVPLPFGVRTITTPRGTHLVKTLDDLHDGGSYVCSDQKRVKPLNLDEVRRRQVPWNTTRPLSAGRWRKQSGRRNIVNNRPAKVTERVAVRTPKKLVVIRNKDPTIKRTIVLHRRIAPTFDALLDYLSQILQFPVLRLYSTDGRRVDGLAALILCSGVVVAAGNEPFRLGHYSFHRTGQMAQVMYVETAEPSMLQPRAQNNKSFSSGRGSRNFSLSSERYIVNQINKSLNGSMNSRVHQPSGSFEGEVNPHHTSVETCETGRVGTERHSCIVPQDDDIEKSFRVNQDGSMTVEMKVRLTIKEEEMLHWTTTLSRSSLRRGTVCASISESDNSSPNSNNAIAKDSSSISEDGTKQENHSGEAGKAVAFNDEGVHEGRGSAALRKGQTGFKRTPTPGPRYVKKTASVESVKMVTESGVHENTLGHYSYMERTADGESSEGYCVITHKSNSNRPIPKPRKTASAGASNKGSRSSIRSTGVAEVLQIESNGMEVTETVMHIYESQGCYDNYVANEEYSTDGAALHDSPVAKDSKPSTASGPRSSSNDIDFSWKPPTADSLQRQKEDMLSLSSEPMSSTHKIMNDLSSVAETESLIATNSKTEATVQKEKLSKNQKNKKVIKPAGNLKSSTSSSDAKQKTSISPSKNSSNDSAGKKSQSSHESAKNGQRSKGAEKKPEKTRSKKSMKDEKTSRKDLALLSSTDNVKRTPPKRQSTNKVAAKDNGHNINTPSGRPPMKKNISDILKPKTSLLPGKKTVSKPKSMSEMRTSSPKQSPEINESVSMPSLNPTPSEIHQYVENWLEKVSPDQVPYTEETFPNEPEPQTKVVFQIGGDSETEENNGSHTTVNEYYSHPGDAVKKSVSCLSVPLCHQAPATLLLHSEQKSRGLCVSMPSVRVDPGLHDNRLRAHKSAEDIGPADNESSSFNILSPKAKIKPVLRQLCSSIQCIRRVSDTDTMSNHVKSNSLPDFSTQVALVFGSSCKAFLSFLSVMTLRDSLTGSAQEDEHQSRSTSEAMLMMESLQKISAIEDEEAQKASLTDLQSRTSSQFRERWRDFQIFRERLESEPLSPRVSETEFALDVVSEGGDAFEDPNVRINELMDELNLPEDLRAEISSTIQHARSFYPVEDSTFVETEKYQSDSEEEVEKFAEECNDERKPSPDILSTCIAGDITEKTRSNREGERYESEQAGPDMKDSEESQTEVNEPINQNEAEEGKDQVVEQREEENQESIEINDADVKEDVKEQDEWESREESVEKVEMGTEDEISEDGEEEEQEKLDGEEVVNETEQRLSEPGDHETGHSNSVESDDRTFVEKTEDEEENREEGRNEVEETDEHEQQISTHTEEEREEGVEEVVSGEVAEETDEDDEEEKTIHKEEENEEHAGDVEETDDEEESENIEEQEDAETDEEGDDVVEKDVGAQMKEETNGEQAENIDEKEEETEEVTEEGEGEVEETDEEEEKAFHKDEESEEEGVEEVVSGEAAEETDEEEEETIHKEEESEEGVEEVVSGDVAEETGEEEEETIHKEEESEEGVEEVVSGEAAEETGEDEEEENTIDDVEEKEEDLAEVGEGDSDGGADETEEVAEETEEKKEVKNTSEVDEEEGREEMDVVMVETHTEEDEPEVVSEESNGKEDEEDKERGQEEECNVDQDQEANVGVGNTGMNRAKLITEEEEDEGEADRDTEEGQACDDDQEISKVQEKVENNLDDESSDEREDVEGLEPGGQMSEQEREYEEDNELREGLEQMEKDKPKAEVEEEAISEDVDAFPADTACKDLLDTISYLRQQSSICDGGSIEQNSESSIKYSSDVQCEDEKGNGTDTVNETDEGGEDRGQRQPHPVEISQELLDFVNSALQSSSLTFSYDSRGNIRIEPDNARVVKTEQVIIPKSSSDSLYGVNCLPSPSTSDLSDYRPESSESGGYKTQESVDIVTESGEDASEKPFPISRRKTDKSKRTVEPPKSKLPVASRSGVLESCRIKSSHGSDSKASREDLSYFSAASSLKADGDAAPGSTQCMSGSSEKDSADGVLIDQGRWLLKENHLIRKSPPISLGMYNNLDSTSIDTGQENTSEDSPPHYKTQHNPLAALSSSELEEMAKPLTPKCTYYNMPHGSDSDPFLDDSSITSGKKDTRSFKGRGSKVTPIDTSKTRVNKNGSLSSFASVEFKIPEKKVHPEGESLAVAQTRRTSSGGGGALQAQDSLDTLHLRCSQYCPIL